MKHKINNTVQLLQMSEAWIKVCKSDELEEIYYELLKEKRFDYKLDILKDIKRTLTFDDYKLESKLYNVLKVYSLYDKEIGYCQGINLVLIPLITNLSEIDSFCCLVHLMIRKGLRELYKKDLYELRLSAYKLNYMIMNHIPNLAHQFYVLGLAPIFYSSKWFLGLFNCLFSDLSPIYERLIFIKDASEFILKLAVIILMKEENNLSRINDFDEIACYLTSAKLISCDIHSLLRDVDNFDLVPGYLDKIKIEFDHEIRTNSKSIHEQKYRNINRRKSSWIASIFRKNSTIDSNDFTSELSDKKTNILIDSVKVDL